MDDIKLLIRKYALDNARRYNGVPSIGAVVGKLVGERPELKAKLKDLMPQINAIANEVKLMDVEAQIAELQKHAPELLVEKRVIEEKKLKPLPDGEKGRVVMRVAPSPSGPLHIGHAVVFSLSHLYAKEYNGKLILRIEDTNPENIFPEAYKMIQEDMNWVTENGIHKTVVQSDHLDIYYKYAEKLLESGKAYVCVCSADLFRDFSMKKKACPCRELPKAEAFARWKKMFDEYEPGQAVVRIKTDLKDPNPAMRDWPALRINHAPHPRQNDKFKVWPLMNFAVAIDDYEMGVTHTIRGKDHVDNAKRQKHVFDFFKWPIPTHLYIGKINFEGLEISKTKVKAEIARGKFDDWDDIRLPFLCALRRRGFQPGAFQSFAKDMGVGLNDKVVPAEDFFKSLESHNRNIIDPKANRYFFVADPVKLTVKSAPEQTVNIHLHPDHPERGDRSFKTNGDFYVPKEDFGKIRVGRMYRLMDCLNFVRNTKECIFDSTEYEKYKHEGEHTIHWLPLYTQLIDVEVLMPDKKLLKGKGEPLLKELNRGDIVQFERFGFCRLDNIEKGKLTFWFTHK